MTEPIIGVPWGLLGFLLVLGPLIFFHELGHLLTAKLGGVTVEEFGFGFPPRLVTLGRWGETVLSLNAIPFGGFVRLRGEDDPNVPDGFAARPWPWRLLILAAGPLMNMLVAWGVLILVFLLGVPAPQVQIQEVAPDSPAAQAGLQSGDLIIALDGVSVSTTEEVRRLAQDRRGQTVTLRIRRRGGEQEVSVYVRPNPPPGQGAMGVVIATVPDYNRIQRFGVSGAVARGTAMFAALTAQLFSLPARIVLGLVPPGVLEPAGPVRIGAEAGEALQTSVEVGSPDVFLTFIGLISLAIAFTNLLPIPALDGGRILFVLAEAIRGQRVDPRRERVIHLIGFFLLLMLLLFLTVREIGELSRPAGP
ncbi:M50 family metallopeptidase [Thermoflexus sp.]|uniref:M50 family metallopeptidase n=1 Tax=Thermoflexus sp. TaxID=1969742 RepID=UPI0025F95EA0|nr:M50 family metallopeptidase [Thermoflexus sp.]MDW8181302.1 M50 family metallopeptidase [Anaerolineae bacterium]MCS6962574.1 M50 family metallopeptidase [Thermoflexus sp.]MCS7351843.1 M50 family metallopeptidase [Thermoflexus sp.]MCX7690383.1 M50 family metallopeptidase [Thermoflexus sp.]MDW8184920.1 M50 family metallopeptidase [Anaerolineae bacterium]